MSTEPVRDTHNGRRAVLACLIGSTVEYYDYFLYGLAASLVFSELFFPKTDPLVGTLLSLSTFAIAFVMRPIGAALFGNLGDRVGRKRVLFITIMLMGVATVAIGLLPTYDQVGSLAPVLLVLARLLQGLALGGEQAGGWVMSVESAGKNNRGLFGALVNSGAGWGLLLANLAFLAVSQLPTEQLLSWGWRVPFLLSAVLVGVGVYIRLKLEESPEFAQLEHAHTVHKTPLLDAVRAGWRQMALVAVSVLGVGVTFSMMSVFSLTYGTTALKLERGTMVSLVLLSTLIIIVGSPLFGMLADRVGRKPVFLVSGVLFAIVPFVWFPLMNTRSYGLMLLGFAAVFLVFSANAAAYPTFFSMVFPTTIRFSGMAVAYNIGTIVGGSVAPLIATAILRGTGSWEWIAVYIATAAVLSVISGSRLREVPDAADAGATDTVILEHPTAPATR